jgi:hypothetical protein
MVELLQLFEEKASASALLFRMIGQRRTPARGIDRNRGEELAQLPRR